MMSSIQKEFQRLKMRLKQENDHHEPSDLHHHHQIHHQQIQTSIMSQSQITQVSSPHRSQANVRSRITNVNLMIDTRRQEYNNPRHLRIDQQQQQQQQIQHNSSVINAQCLSPRPRPRDCKL